jgi:hypothetical protein
MNSLEDFFMALAEGAIFITFMITAFILFMLFTV